MKSLGLISFQPLFLLCFCFKNLDLSTIQLDYLEASPITFFEPILLVCFLQPKQ